MWVRINWRPATNGRSKNIIVGARRMIDWRNAPALSGWPRAIEFPLTSFATVTVARTAP
jgi:hypothetical protein